MNNIFFTSDTHFGHKNIIKFSNRPFASVSEMDEAMIERWNSKISEDDTVYHLGDVGLCSSNQLKSILERLNGKIHLIRGNHDSAADKLSSHFKWIKDYHELIVEDKGTHQGKRLIVLSHYAMRVWNVSHHGSWHLYGHSHGDLLDLSDSLSFDVGVDCHNYYPLSYEEVKEIMNNKNWKSPFS